LNPSAKEHSVSSPIPFDNTYARLPERFYVKQAAEPVPAPRLLRVNRALAEELGIDLDWLDTPDALNVFSGNSIAPGSEPLAQAYAGHQFGGLSPQLGDGRALLLGEVVDQHGRRRDIQLKGSGRTPFSRGGDGKSALGPVLREYMVSEAMHALGVPTTRALAAVTTGEDVLRQEGHITGGVFTRVASSHIRVGTFEYFALRNDVDALRELADYTIARHYPEAAESENPYLSLLDRVIAGQAALIPRWMALGFIHGVMNTDNTALSGETIDYGPCAFMDTFSPDCVFSSIDSQGRYAWGNQPAIAQWNLTRFAETLLPLISDDKDLAVERATQSLSRFSDLFHAHYTTCFRAKFGLPENASLDIVQKALDLLADQSVDFTLFFRHLSYGNRDELRGLFDDPAKLNDWLAEWEGVTGSAPDIAAMKQSNPVRIPRNHQVERAIQAAYADDFAPFHQLIEALEKPYEDLPAYSAYEKSPEPHEIVHQTFCGT
jgi:uncharacterized protein YdiU (UPF0061 family)